MTYTRDEDFTCSIVGCARCHGDGHDDVTWMALEHPVDFEDGFVATHWAPCPANGQPILMGTARKTECSG